MAVLVDQDTKLCVSGITGREGTFHAMNNRRYGTQVVSGVTPGKEGQDVEGVPVFNTFKKAVAETGANTAMVFVPPRFAADSILEAADAGIELIIAITEGIPAHDELRVYNHLATNDEEGRRLLAEANLPNVHTEATMLGAARRVVELAGGGDGSAEGVTVPPGEGREEELGAADARREVTE